MLPPALSDLDFLARNLWWSWDADATALWRSIDPWRWELTKHNPVALLQDIDSSRWNELAADHGFLSQLAETSNRFRAYLAESGWCEQGAPDVYRGGVAYFCMEFGLHESVRIYSGGLGVLAGDHIRSSSDLGIPLIGVGLLYRRGYFRQLIDDGRQVPAFPEADYSRLPISKVKNKDGHPIRVEVPIAGHRVWIEVWRLDVGRTRIYLLDTELSDNHERDRSLTHQLYGGDQENRIRQEIVLGIGGVRALRAIGETPAVFHMNEGHCAFLTIELLREQLASGNSMDAALADVRHRCVFTTHTPVPAGHDRFDSELVERNLAHWRKYAGLELHTLMDLGRVRPGDAQETLCMTVLALRASKTANGVSALHGEVSREMWHGLWPDRPVADVPIRHITNGVHPTFWMASPARRLFDQYLPQWRTETHDPAAWSGVDAIPDQDLWNLRNQLRSQLIDVVRTRTGRSLDPHRLTLGFARRFAPYKRGALLFRDLERLLTLLDHCPFQLIFSGKAHPADVEGRKLVAEVVRWCEDLRFRDRVVFVEDYDLYLGHILTAGADVWLNNPRRPQEASGTSGQKVVLNGGLNLSILDGWWAEAYDGHNGWAIGSDQVDPNVATQDHADSVALYEVLEQQLLPEWQARDEQGLPIRWLQRIRASLRTNAPAFNTHRMLRDYVHQLYTPSTHG